MPSLYTLTEQMQQFIEMVDNGEIPEEAIADTLEALEGEITAKIDDIAVAVKNMQAFCAALKAEEDTLKKRRQKKERELERLTQYLTYALNTHGMDKHESARCKVSFRTSTGVRVSDTAAFLEWAKKNAPELINTKVTEAPALTTIAEALERMDVPFCEIETRKNVQIK